MQFPAGLLCCAKRHLALCKRHTFGWNRVSLSCRESHHSIQNRLNPGEGFPGICERIPWKLALLPRESMHNLADFSLWDAVITKLCALVGDPELDSWLEAAAGATLTPGGRALLLLMTAILS